MQIGMVGLGRVGANMARRLAAKGHELFVFDVSPAAVKKRHSSWLLDFTATALVEDPRLDQFSGRVSDSREGRWTIKAGVDEGVPRPVLTTALYERFSSRGDADFANKLVSAMRYEFGGHL